MVIIIKSINITFQWLLCIEDYWHYVNNAVNNKHAWILGIHDNF